MAGRLAYYAAAVSAVLSPAWVDPNWRGWRAGMFVAWALSAWVVFVWFAPDGKSK